MSNITIRHIIFFFIVVMPYSFIKRFCSWCKKKLRGKKGEDSGK